MKTRIVIKKPDYAGDVKVLAEAKEGFFSEWERLDYTWAFRANGDMPGQVDAAVERMKRAIDLRREIPNVIIYPEGQ